MGTTVVATPKTWSDGDTITAADLNANHTALKTAAETDKWDDGNLKKPKALFPLSVGLDVLAKGETIERRTKVPAGVTVDFVSVTLCIDKITDTPTVELMVYKDSVAAGNKLWATALSVTAVDTMDDEATFAIANVAAGTVLIFEFKETSNTGTDQAEDVQAVLWCKALHQA